VNDHLNEAKPVMGVSSYHWSCSAAEVACRQLGYAGVEYYSLQSKFVGFQSDLNYIWSRVDCNGDESKLIECDTREYDGVDRYGEVAGVSCFQSEPSSTTTEVSTPAPPEDCPYGWLDAGALGCYKVVTNLTEGLTWMHASWLCEDLGGYLVELSTEDDHQLVVSLLNILSASTEEQNWWIFLSDNGNEGDWVWMHSYDQVTDSQWAPFSPNNEENNHDDCVLLSFSQFYLWMDVPCETTMLDDLPIGAICRR